MRLGVVGGLVGSILVTAGFVAACILIGWVVFVAFGLFSLAPWIALAMVVGGIVYYLVHSPYPGLPRPDPVSQQFLEGLRRDPDLRRSVEESVRPEKTTGSREWFERNQRKARDAAQVIAEASAATLAAILVAVLILAAVGGAFGGGTRATKVYLPATLESDPGTIVGTVSRLAASDNDRATVSEEDVTALANALTWLTPTSDVGPNNVAQSIACTSEYQCVDDSPVHDGNTTILVGRFSAGWTLSAVGLSNMVSGSDVTVDSVTVWAWARENSTGVEALIFELYESGVDCGQGITPVLTQAFANVSGSMLPVAPCGDGSAWTVADANGLEILLSVGGANAVPVTVTSEGLTVQYDDSDFQVVAYVNFTGVGGTGHQLRYEGSTSLTETLSLQVQRGSSWVTLVNPWLGASEQSETITLNQGGTDVTEGIARFRIVDNTQNEETGQSFLLDEFVIVSIDAPPPPPGGGDPTILSCSVSWNEISCRVSLVEGAVGFAIYDSRWSLDGAFVGIGQGDGQSHSFVFPVRSWTRQVYNVSVSTLVNGQRFTDSADLVQDNVWLFGLLFALVAILVLVALFVLARVGRRRIQASRRRRDDERMASMPNYRMEFWRGGRK